MAKNIRSNLCLRGGGADQKRKEARKRKFAHTKDDQLQALINPGLGVMDVLAEQRPSKKQKPEPQSSQPRSNDHTDQAHQTNSGAEYDSQPVSAAIIENGPGGHEAQNGTDQPQRAQRFIVFIGNLPYTSTTASITAHFKKVQPNSIRHRTNKQTGQSRGFAFLEFAAYDRMRACLKLYHHSMFDDGQSPARKINVELTVGGGGAKSTSRKSRLKAKNWKLTEERRRRADEEARVERKKVRKTKNEVGRQDGKGKVRTRTAEEVAADDGDIHPSRRGRVSTG